MQLLESYRTSDSSKKVTTYVFKDAMCMFSFDFGSNEIPINDVKRLNYIFITHEHSDHFMGLYNLQYVEALLDSKCEIYASNVTKDLIIAIFENALKVSFDEKAIKKIRELLKRIKGVLFFEKIKLTDKYYFKLFPSGHTYGSSMVYLNTGNCNILYTGDMDFDLNDIDRQYQLDFEKRETVDYIIADGTYLDSEQFKDETLTKIRDGILNRNYDNFLCKPEKAIFFSKKIMSSNKLNNNYCVVFTSEIKWYLKVLEKYNYNPFITDKILLKTSIYALPDNKKPLYVSSRKKNHQTVVNSVVGLHISFMDFAYFVQQFEPNKTKLLIGHYNQEKKDAILCTFHSSSLLNNYDVTVLDGGQIEL